MSKDGNKAAHYRDETLLSVLGRDPAANHGVVNPPVYHASTILHESAAALKEATFGPREYGKTYYGRFGTPTTFPLQDSIATLEQGYRTYLFGSGKAAIVAALLAFVKSGDHVLMTDSAYGPTRALAGGLLKRMGVETSFYDPCIGARLADLMRANTSVVVGESPGSLTFEVQDLPALAAAAHAGGAVLVVDNTWASPLFCQPLSLGADVSIQAGTKYIVGHSDAMLGAVTTTEAHVEALRHIFEELGAAPGPDDCYLGLRGLRTLSVRLRRHEETGLRLARWLQGPPRGPPRPPPRAGGRPRPCALAARLLRRIEPLRRGAGAGAGACGRCLSRFARAVRPRLLMGRLREPGAAHLSLEAAGRVRLGPDLPVAPHLCRPGRRGRPHRRPRPGLRAHGRGALGGVVHAPAGVPMYNWYFEDLEPGLRFETMGKTLSEAEILDFAFRYDPQPFHMDVDYAEKGPYGGLIASGIQTIAVALRMFFQSGVFAPEISIGSPGVDELRWLQPVRPRRHHPRHRRDPGGARVALQARARHRALPDGGPQPAATRW